MVNLLEQVRILAEQMIQTMGYPGIAILMFVENIFPPIPSEVVMPFAGFLVDKGEMSFAGVMIAGTIGAALGAVAIYYIGVRFGEGRLRRWIGEHGRYLLMSEDDLESSLETFSRHGKKMVLFGRVLPGIRSLISLPAGLKKMHLGIFLLFTLVGTTLWNLFLAGGGFILGRNWQQVLAWLDTYETIVTIIVIALILGYVGQRLVKRKELAEG